MVLSGGACEGRTVLVQTGKKWFEIGVEMSFAKWWAKRVSVWVLQRACFQLWCFLVDAHVCLTEREQFLDLQFGCTSSKHLSMRKILEVSHLRDTALNHRTIQLTFFVSNTVQCWSWTLAIRGKSLLAFPLDGRRWHSNICAREHASPGTSDVHWSMRSTWVECEVKQKAGDKKQLGEELLVQVPKLSSTCCVSWATKKVLSAFCLQAVDSNTPLNGQPLDR